MSTEIKWHIIYPAYINSNRTVAAGRRLNRNECVTDPKWTEIRDVLEANACFKVEAQSNKCYPRELDKESPVFRGRVHYQCLDGEKFAKKRDVLRYVAVMIPKLKTRTKTSSNDSSVGNTSASNAVTKKKRSKK